MKKNLIHLRRQTSPFMTRSKAPLSINPEQTPAFRPGCVEGLIFIIFVSFGLFGCGYTTHSAVHSSLRSSVLPSVVSSSGKPSIFIEDFVNKIDVTKEVSNEEVYYPYLPGMEADITREVINKFIRDGNYEVKDRENAKFSLKGQLVDFRREPLRYDANDNVIEYRLSVVVNIELYDLKDSKTVWQEKGFAGESTYRSSGQFAKAESAAIEDTTSDLAGRIVERTVESW